MQLCDDRGTVPTAKLNMFCYLFRKQMFLTEGITKWRVRFHKICLTLRAEVVTGFFLTWRRHHMETQSKSVITSRAKDPAVFSGMMTSSHANTFRVIGPL